MKKVIIGLVIGSAIGYCIRKMQDDGQFDYIQELLGKTKKNVKNVIDIAGNEAEHLKDHIENKFAK